MNETITRSESKTERFGRVITYSVRIGDVHYRAERMVGLSAEYSIWSTVGRCGMSFEQHGKIAGGRGVGERLLHAARRISDSGAAYAPHTRCCDREACEKYAEASA